MTDDSVTGSIRASHFQRRPGLFARTIVILAMLVQIVFFAEHTGAVVAQMLGAKTPETRLGFLELCTGNGIFTAVRGDSEAPGGDCPICANASVMAFSEPEALQSPVFAAIALGEIGTPGQPVSLTSALFPGVKPIRAPPVA